MQKSNSGLSLGRLRRRNSDAGCSANNAADASSRGKNAGNDSLDRSGRASRPKSPASPSKPAAAAGTTRTRRVRAYTKYDYGDPLQGPAGLGQSTSRERQRSQSLNHPPIPSEITFRIGGGDAAADAGGGSASAAGRSKDSSQVPIADRASNLDPSWSQPKRPAPNAKGATLCAKDFTVRRVPTYSEWRALMPAAAPEGPPNRHQRRSCDGREGTGRTKLARRKKGSEHPITCIGDDEQEQDVAAAAVTTAKAAGADDQNLDLDLRNLNLGAPDLDLPPSLYPQLRREHTYPP